jgi:hypothetical protein
MAKIAIFDDKGVELVSEEFPTTALPHIKQMAQTLAAITDRLRDEVRNAGEEEIRQVKIAETNDAVALYHDTFEKDVWPLVAVASEIAAEAIVE